MKQLLLLAALPIGLFAQTVEGTWQGTLKPAPNREIQMAFRITRDGNAYQGIYYNLAANRQLNLGAVTLQGKTVKIVIPGMGGTYEGRFEADENSISGTLTQGTGASLSLPLARATAETAWELPPPPRAPKPLPEGTKLEFEVASIKPSRAAQRAAAGFNMTSTELRSGNVSVAGIITFAFELHRTQVLGLRSWADSEGYEIVSRLPAGGEPNDVQLRAMLKNLLETRFDLAFHMEKREMPVYAIGLGRNGQAGVKLTPNTSSGVTMNSQGLGRVSFRGLNMGDLANQLQLRVLDRPVIDETALMGRYDFTLNWRPDEFQLPFATAAQRSAAAASADALPDLFTAF